MQAINDQQRWNAPFRNSKLTKVLKDSMEDDNCSVVMLVCVSPSLDSYRETCNTL